MFDQNNGVRFVTVSRYAELSGLSESAIFERTQNGTWVENREWKWTPDGRKMIDIEGVQAWCLREGKPSTRGRKKSDGVEHEHRVRTG